MTDGRLGPEQACFFRLRWLDAQKHLKCLVKCVLFPTRLFYKEAFQVSQHSKHQKSTRRKHRIHKRLATRRWKAQTRPMFRGTNIHYDVADRTHAMAAGGIGAIHLLARRTGLVEAIDQQVHVLKRHLPYHESDHVLNIAYNLLAGRLGDSPPCERRLPGGPGVAASGRGLSRRPGGAAHSRPDHGR